MICKKCGAELPDLTMYCTNCGAPQFEAPKTEVNLTLESSRGSKVVIKVVKNMTSALTQIRDLTEMTIPEVRKFLQELPAELLSGLSEDEAEKMASILQEGGIIAEAIHPGRKEEPAPVQEPEPEPVPQTPVFEEPVIEQPVQEEMPAEEPAPVEEPAPAEEPVIEQPIPEPAAEEAPAEEPAIPAEQPAENVPQLTLEPPLSADESFMKEMEEFLGDKEKPGE